MKTVIKLVVMLVIATSNIVLADDGGSQSEVTQPMPLQDISPSMRVITEQEFNGTDPIIVNMHETLIIPLHYTSHSIPTFSFFYTVDNKSVMSMIGGEPTFSDCNMILDMNFICTPLKPGQATAIFGDNGQIYKRLIIQITE